MNGTDIVQRLERIRNLVDAGIAVCHTDDDKTLFTVLESLLVKTWELCRDANPAIIIAAGSAITPPGETTP